IGYWKPYATSHDELDADHAVQTEVRNAALALAEAVEKRRAGSFQTIGAGLEDPRPK
ncbi:MAG: NADPH-dependent FMN reductase, partial [Mesorhizobium sp.]